MNYTLRVYVYASTTNAYFFDLNTILKGNPCGYHADKRQHHRVALSLIINLAFLLTFEGIWLDISFIHHQLSLSIEFLFL